MLSWCFCRLPSNLVGKHRHAVKHPTVTCRAASHSSPLRILGIESSCDDTGVAVVTSEGQLLGESLATQTDIHAPWGGVVPKLAEEAHAAAMDRCVTEALQHANLQPQDLSAVAVTVGPGLSLCLRVGVAKAQQLSRQYELPLVPVHHMEAHALVARMFAGGTTGAVQFPFLCLLVSGGHNLLLLVYGVGQYRQLGTTLDDALGEAYDKVARLLGLELVPSGGAALESLALQGDSHKFPFPIPLRTKPNCNFSYAGLKTAVRLACEAELGAYPATADLQTRADIAASFQRVAVEHLAVRTARAAKWAKEEYPELPTLVVAGGVAANKLVRSRLQEVAGEQDLQLVCPPARYCTDNGVMVAWAGVERYQMGLCTPPLSSQHVTAPASVASTHTATSNNSLAISQPNGTHSTPSQATSTPHEAPLAGPPGPTSEGAPSAGPSAEMAPAVPFGGPTAEGGAGAPSKGAAAPHEQPSQQEQPEQQEWVELHPRWPLTAEVDGRGTPPLRSARKKRLHLDLTTLTRQQLQEIAQRRQGGTQEGEHQSALLVAKEA